MVDDGDDNKDVDDDDDDDDSDNDDLWRGRGGGLDGCEIYYLFFNERLLKDNYVGFERQIFHCCQSSCPSLLMS